MNEEVFASLGEVRAVIESWRKDDNRVRPRLALGGLTPEAGFNIGSAKIYPPGSRIRRGNRDVADKAHSAENGDIGPKLIKCK